MLDSKTDYEIKKNNTLLLARSESAYSLSWGGGVNEIWGNVLAVL